MIVEYIVLIRFFELRKEKVIITTGRGRMVKVSLLLTRGLTFYLLGMEPFW